MATWLLQINSGYDKDKLVKAFLKKFDISHFELTLLENTTDSPLKIEDVRKTLKKIHLVPGIGQAAGLLVLGADEISLPVAATFLKTLEEPPSYLEICLVVQNPRQLPKTVLSRAKTLTLDDTMTGDKTAEPDDRISFFALQKLPLDELFSLAETIAKNKQTANYLLKWLKEIENTLDKNPQKHNLEIFRLLAADLKLVENQNLNQRLLLENFFLKLPVGEAVST